MHRAFVIASLGWLVFCPGTCASEEPLKVSLFRVDATPPIGSPLCEGAVEPAKEIVDPLTARGIVLFSDESPIVLCAVDWVGIGNTAHDAFRRALAEAAVTTFDRVSVHVLHQHDAPGVDFAAEELLAQRGLSGAMFDVASTRHTIERTAAAVRESLKKPERVTHLGVGRGRVSEVASNRRVLGPDGKVKHVRYSSCTDPEVRAAPEGTIDPFVQLINFWDGDRPIASLTYYATHPQSYYGQGGVSADFVGRARSIREAELPHVAHIHFNGASGNVAAGKYNDGSPANRPVLANRLADGMKAAWDSTARTAIQRSDVRWRVQPVALPLRDLLVEERLLQELDNPMVDLRHRIRAAIDLAWTRRVTEGHKIELACLRLGSVYVLHMPGELFVEYQLAAQKLRPNDTVCMAAYGDLGPGYIGTEIAYSEGGYETGTPSRVAPQVESVLMDGIRDLLK